MCGAAAYCKSKVVQTRKLGARAVPVVPPNEGDKKGVVKAAPRRE
jgi:hypothetical protein